MLQCRIEEPTKFKTNLLGPLLTRKTNAMFAQFVRHTGLPKYKIKGSEHSPTQKLKLSKVMKMVPGIKKQVKIKISQNW